MIYDFKEISIEETVKIKLQKTEHMRFFELHEKIKHNRSKAYYFLLSEGEKASKSVLLKERIDTIKQLTEELADVNKSIQRLDILTDSEKRYLHLLFKGYEESARGLDRTYNEVFVMDTATAIEKDLDRLRAERERENEIKKVKQRKERRLVDFSIFKSFFNNFFKV